MNSRIQGFSYYFSLMREVGSVPLTNGSGYRGQKHRYGPDPQHCCQCLAKPEYFDDKDKKKQE
jgi:hypothetical protein